MLGGQAPHISKRKGNIEPKRADVLALPNDYARKLVKNTINRENRLSKK